MARSTTLRSLLILVSFLTLAHGTFAATPRKAAKARQARTERRMVAPFTDPTLALAAWTEQQRAIQASTVRTMR
ncbi:MAG: hypothetical protein IT228_11635 [Flavobacteriales bacterium]|nr:hypothetical protein [Flavobacteriales bacterium]MCC6577984.1 hypothetical protein [Flavobacteriales bacterium]NUQ14380.1 hypothetical protein [Flavobacteriales bacterium]